MAICAGAQEGFRLRHELPTLPEISSLSGDNPYRKRLGASPPAHSEEPSAQLLSRCSLQPGPRHSFGWRDFRALGAGAAAAAFAWCHIEPNR